MLRARFYHIPCHFNPVNDELTGRNQLYDLLLAVMVRVHVIFTMIFFFLPSEFPIEIEESE